MALPTYSNLDEKNSEFVSHIVINTKDELDSQLKDLKDKESHKKERYLFRGHNEAKYKLYTSAQRYWDMRNLDCLGLNYTQSIIKMIDSVKASNHPFNSYLKRLDVVQNDWLILSFLQHYGAVTPLLDFSRKYLVALFFAIDKIRFSNDNAIDNYVSLYYYRAVEAAKDVSVSITSLAERSAKAKRTWKKDFWNDLSYEKVMNSFPTVILPAYSNCTKIVNSSKQRISTYTIANLNATAQEGEFVCNGDANKPLEKIWITADKKYIHCIDIHKGLYEYILTKIMNCSIDEARKRYYLDEKELAQNAQLEMLSSL